MSARIRMLSIFFLIGGLLIFLMAGDIKEEAQPNKVTFGTVINGEYTETDQGYIGGNKEVHEDMDYLKGIGIIVILLGACGFIGSFAIKSKE